MSKILCNAYIFYKWDENDSVDSVLDRCDDNTGTIHTEVSFRTDGVVLRKTDCKIFDPTKHIKKMSYDEFCYLMNTNYVKGELYDWGVES